MVAFVPDHPAVFQSPDAGSLPGGITAMYTLKPDSGTLDVTGTDTYSMDVAGIWSVNGYAPFHRRGLAADQSRSGSPVLQTRVGAAPLQPRAEPPARHDRSGVLAVQDLKGSPTVASIGISAVTSGSPTDACAATPTAAIRALLDTTTSTTEPTPATVGGATPDPDPTAGLLISASNWTVAASIAADAST